VLESGVPQEPWSAGEGLAARLRSVARGPALPLAAMACAAVVALALGSCAAQRAVLADRPVLEGLSGPLDALLDAGRALRRLSGGLEGLRTPLALAFAGLLGFGLRSPRWRALAGAGGALGLAAVGQGLLLDGPRPVGLGLLGAAALAWLWRADAQALPRSGRPLSPPLEAAVAALLVGAFVVLCLFRIDVRPDLYFDEQAYVEAARRYLAGHLAGGIDLFPYTEAYHQEQFAAQRVPFWLGAAAAARVEPDLLALRLASVAAATAALIAGHAAIRAALGGGAALGMLALASPAPLGLAYARPGLYIAASVLHAACSVLAALGFVARPDARRAALLGALLGGSLYFYQLSWLVPPLCAASVAAAWVGRPLRPLLGPTGLALGVALAVAVPGAVLQADGLAAVGDQTFDRVIGSGDAPLLVGTGSPWGNAASMAARLFAEGGPESASRLVRAPLLGPWVAPLVVLGLVEALRRRREPPVRLLLAWTLCAALLPAAATAGGVLPRRAVLVWPLAWGLAALPLLAGLRAARAHGRAVAALATVATGVWIAGAAATGAAVYHDAWPHASLRGPRTETTAIGTSVLALARAWRGLDPSLRILVPGHLPGLAGYLVNVEGEAASTPEGPKRIFPGPGHTSEEVRLRSCATAPPFAWIHHRDASERFETLYRDFHVRTERRGDFRVVRVDAVRPGGCRRGRAPANGSAPRGAAG